MLTVMGLKRKKAMLVKLAEQSDAEFSAVIQGAVLNTNRLILDRGGAVTSKPQQPVDKNPAA